MPSSSTESEHPNLKFDFSRLDESLKPLPKRYLDNIRSYISVDEVGVILIKPAAPQWIEQQCLDALKSFGYYHANCQLMQPLPESIVELKRDFDNTLTLKLGIVLNQPIKVRERRIDIEGDARVDQAFQTMIDGLPLEVEAPLHHAEYKRIKNRLLALAMSRGYFDAYFEVHEINLYRGAGVADIHLKLNSGTRYRYGEIRVEGASVNNSLLVSMREFDTGDYYDANLLVDFNRQLLNSQFFSQVKIIPDIVGRAEGRVSVTVQVQMNPKNTVRFGLGYATDERARTSIGWTRPWVGKRGQSFAMQTKVSAIKKRVEGKFTTPVHGNVRRQLVQNVGWERDDSEERETLFSGLSYTMALEKKWFLAPFVRVEQERFKELGVPQRATSIVPGLELWRRRKRGGLDPTWGDYLHVDIESGAKEIASEIDFLRLHVVGKILRQPWPKQRAIVGIQLGTVITGDDISLLPDSFRFRTGGDQSIRGFSYNAIGAEQAIDAIEIEDEGAKNLATLSVEYDWEFIDRWRVAVFTDVGDAFNDTYEEHIGVGTGVRWLSPVGPIKFDIAFPVSEEDDAPRVHFAMGLSL